MTNYFPIYIVIPTTKERRPQTDRLIESIRENTKIPHVICVYENADGGWVPAVHKALDSIDGFVVLLGSDVVVHEGWLDALWDGFCDAFPKKDGCAQPFDEINNGALCQHPLGHSSVIKHYLHKGYIHNFSDNEMTERLIRDRKYLYVPESKIEHLHWVNGKAQQDETYKVIMSSYERDREVYLERKRNGYPEEK